MDRLNRKNNWIVEFATIKLVLQKQLKKFNSNICRFIKRPLLENEKVYIQGQFVEISLITTRDLYNTLNEKKFERPYAEKMWERKLNLIISKKEWENIYNINCKQMQCNKIAEFK